ncbi:hypothetical protein NECAME_01403 [Necator americanus]|uniref:BZIP domain-containing protein n=1 Tax=Necator americanus TaxID=51031 RepID=W2TV42_NECAM|nr:hypothetical protein NECAME_01403 [Necator americanus]ETN85514.1 hypothetical protein NECAME_01403 [Necator americanus]
MCRKRSESEYRAPVVSANCLVPTDDSETVVFYSPQYEENLLMKYLGESSSGDSVDECSTLFCNYDSHFANELLEDNMMPSYGSIDPTHSPVSLYEATSFCDDMNTIDGCSVTKAHKSEEESRSKQKPLTSPSDARIQKPSRRGRPMKITSTSKMANYARNYREQKKSQLIAYEAQVKQLTEENEYLRAENKRLTEGFARLNKQVENLRRMLENNSHFSHDSLQTPFASPIFHQKDFADDLLDFNDLVVFPQ